MRKQPKKRPRSGLGQYKSPLVYASVFLGIVSFVASGYRQDVQAQEIPVEPLLAVRLAEDVATTSGLPISERLSIRASSLASQEETIRPVLDLPEDQPTDDAPVTAPDALVEPLPIAEEFYRPALAVDPSGNRYAPGNCTWYAYERRLQLGRPIGSFWGNAAQWSGSALAAGLNVNNTPDVGSILVDFTGYYGHVAVVEELLPGGGVRISEMNSAWGGGFNIVSGRVLSALEARLYLYIQ